MSRPQRPAPPEDAVAGEKAAWLAVAEALRRQKAAREPDLLLLAAWIEGRLDEASAAPVERWIAQDPAQARHQIAALRDSLEQQPVVPPRRLLRRLTLMMPR